jgi:hypothetical protein
LFSGFLGRVQVSKSDSSEEGGYEMRLCIVLALVLVLASSAFALEKKAYQMKEDFGTESIGIADGTINYYYYIPCPTYSWFWSYTGWTPGEIIGNCFNATDEGTGGSGLNDPAMCHELTVIRILDFAGYGTVYPGKFTVEFDVYCAEECCGTAAPVTHLWNSGPFETGYAWNYIYVDPYLCLTECDPTGVNVKPFVVTATHTGTDGIYPAWGMDNISTAVETGCPLHDYGCLPAAYPRFACGAGVPAVHGGYIGTYPFEYWPPLSFLDGRDTTPDGSQFGAIELAWRAYFQCAGPTATEPSSWGNIKSMYR